jgi:polygalacturonase
MKIRSHTPSVFLSLAACFLLLGCNRPTASYNIKDFGARGNGKSLCTGAINKAILKCNKHGGGSVIVPPGTYVSGTIVLLSHVDLHLEPGAVILGSEDTNDYRLMPGVQFSEGYNRYGMVCAEDAMNISITGRGEINGNGTFFMNGLDKPHMGGNDFDRKYIRQGDEFMKPGTVFEDGPVSYNYRPGMLVTLERCENILISDVCLRDAPEWTFRIGDCDDVHIRGISIINNPLIPNSDGIHVTTSRNVRISDCHIVAGDDAIIVTGFGHSPVPPDLSGIFSNGYKVGNKTGLAENVTVTNSVLSSRSACIRVGYGNHPIRNLLFSNLVMVESNRGIGVFARDSSIIDNVAFDHIIIHNRLHSGHWWGKGEPVHVSALQDSPHGPAGRISNIRFSNIHAESETGMVIFGTSGSRIENITLNNIELTIRRGKYSDPYGGNFDLRPAHPVSMAIFKQDIPGLFAQYVGNLKIADFELTWGDNLPAYFTHAIQVVHFKDIQLENVTGSPADPASGLAALHLSEGSGFILRNFINPAGSTILTKVNVK